MADNEEQEKLERKRAVVAQRVAAMEKELEAEWPLTLALNAMQARRLFAKFEALQKAGFLPEQALELCWRLR